MLGYDVNKYVIDSKSADAALSLRSTFAKVENLANWLANHPVVDNVDPLVELFGYNPDEAYLLRVTFEQFDMIRINNPTLFYNARKFTGLE